MYFKDKSTTNIDSEFKNNNNKFNLLDFIKNKKLILIISIIIIVLIITIIIITTRKKDNIITYLTLSGSDTITIYQNSNYLEPGYKAYNSNNEDLTNLIKIDSNLNTEEIGEYKVTYTINNITKIRNIKVIKQPKDYTYIYLNNGLTLYLKVGEKYEEPGYMVFSTDDNLTDKVTITGKVDTSKKGIYKLTYSVVDSKGVTATKVREVHVLDTEISLTLDNKEYTTNPVTININIIDNFFDYLLLPDGNKITTLNYSYKVSTNGTYKFKVFDKRGNTKETSITVNNIDKTAPTGSCNGSYGGGKSTININANDNIGIIKYEIDGKDYKTNKITINKDLTNVTINIYDKANNKKTISCTLKNNTPASSSSSSKPSSTSKPSSSNTSSSNKPSSSSNSNQITKNISVNLYKNFSYWLYLPDKITSNLPIIVYLPGTGERGNDYYGGTKAISYGPISDIKNRNYSYNAIIIHMQVPANEGVYNYLDNYINLINSIADKYNANKNKISIAGFSHGCYGLVNLIEKYPNYLSAGVFIGCSPNKRIDINKYTHQAVWSFVGAGDGMKDYSDQYGQHYSLENFVKAINNAGGNAKNTIVADKSAAHNIVNNSYSVFRDTDFNLINWMISKTKGA